MLQEARNERGNGVASRGEVAPQAKICRFPPPPGGDGGATLFYALPFASFKMISKKTFGGKRRQREEISKR